jgi:WD40 repeat protein
MLLVSCEFPESVTLWNVDTGQEVTPTPEYARPSPPEEMLNRRHARMIFSPDGATIADLHLGGLSLYDAQSGKQRAFLPMKGGGHSGPPFPFCYSPDGKLIALGSSDALLLVDAARCEIRQTLREGAPVRAAAFSPDSHWLVGGNEVGDVLVWDAYTGKRRDTLSGHREQIVAVAFAPHGDQLASASADGVLALWRMNTGKLVRTFLENRARNRCLAYSPDGKFLMTGGEPSPELWDTTTWQSTHWIGERSGYASAAAFTPDGKTVVLGLAKGGVEVWDVAARRVTRAWQAGKHLYKVLIVADGKQLTTIGDHNSARTWNLADGAQTQPETVLPAFPEAISADLGVTASHNEDYVAELWDNKTGQRLQTLNPGKIAVTLALSADGSRAATHDPDANITVWDVGTGKALHTFPDDRTLEQYHPYPFQVFGATKQIKADLKRGSAHLALNADGSRLAASLSVMWRPPATPGKPAISYLPLGVHDVTNVPGSHSASQLEVWDLTSGKQVAAISDAHPPGRHLVLSPDGQMAAMDCSGLNHDIVVFDIAARKSYTLTGISSYVTAMEFSPDSKTLLAADQNGIVKLWNLP